MTPETWVHLHMAYCHASGLMVECAYLNRQSPLQLTVCHRVLVLRQPALCTTAFRAERVCLLSYIYVSVRWYRFLHRLHPNTGRFQYKNKLMQLLIVFIYLSNYLLDMFRATSAHHQEFSLLYMQPPVMCVAACPWHCLVVNNKTTVTNWCNFW
jgi:heme/copper-type cytochrome/quinol oxidase subunit 4